MRPSVYSITEASSGLVDFPPAPAREGGQEAAGLEASDRREPCDGVDLESAAGVVPGLPCYAGMIDTIVRLTVLAVLALAAANAVHACAVLARFAHHAGQRHGRLKLWLPAFASLTDVCAWLQAWRVFLASPRLLALRADARVILVRHVHLALLAHTWTIALGTLV
jgi:hypothetical protein